MICSNCGNEIPNDATFCPVCGANSVVNKAPMFQGAPVYNPMPATPNFVNSDNKASKGLVTGMIVTVSVCVIAILLTIFAPYFLLSGAESAAKKAALAKWNYDAEALINTLPESFIDAVLDSKYCDKKIKDKDDIIDEAQDDLDDMKENSEDYYDENDMDMPENYKFIKAGTLKIGKDEKEDLIEEEEDYLEDKDIDVEIQDVAKVYLVLSYKQNGETSEGVFYEYMYKIDGKWCSSTAIQSATSVIHNYDYDYDYDYDY